MKAWIVREKDEFEAAVVFAETRGQAKMMALLYPKKIPPMPSLDRVHCEGGQKTAGERSKQAV